MRAEQAEAGPLRYISVGDGPPLLLWHGFAMQPATYLPLARLLAPRAQVVIPAIFAVAGRWTEERVLDGVEILLDDLALDRVSMLGHSFGGGLELGFAARRPERVVECIFADTLAMKEGLGLAQEASSHPLGILAMATPPAAGAFFRSFATHPVQLGRAGLWGFATDRRHDIEAVVTAGIPCHVLWANHDTLLARSDGAAFAKSLDATFTVASDGRVEHDWMFDDPERFLAHLEEIGLRLFEPSPTGDGSDRRLPAHDQ